ncbi:hypothetical protein F1880_008918 [Penicillium rolfsii]|nr:hypothetical protein F1880_008918 [Penicillium rolfsii]
MAGNTSWISERLMGRDDSEFDPEDLSFIKSIAAIGDSYSAGIGAGERIDWSCSRYDNAYPYLTHTDERLGDPSARNFEFRSCSGAVIDDVLKKQIPYINGNQQVILLSAGGNDAQLSKILNQCIFQWAVLNSDQVTLAKTAAIADADYAWAKSYDWDSLGIGCEGQLAHTNKIIASDSFKKSLDEVISAAKLKLSSDGMLYYTGTGLMFYELNTMDAFGNNPWKRSTEEHPEDSFEGSVNQFAEITYLVDPGAKLVEAALVSDDTSTSTASLAVLNVAFKAATASIGSYIPNLLPDGFGRVFHPQPLLHQVIASLIIYEMTDKNAQDNGFSAIEEEMPILIANVVNGPDSAKDDNWATVINRASSAGKTVLGYVRTGYLGVSQQKFVTRLGSGDLADWTAQIEEDIDMWYNLYGNSIGGIFFDEGWPECGDSNQYVNLYKHINDYTKRKYLGAYTILNHGSPMASCFEDTMDTLLTFELDYTAYTASYTPNDWTPKDPRKLWHIIYNVPEDAIDEVMKLSKERGAGFVQLTSDVLPNPYDNLPDSSYMSALMNAVTGGSLENDVASSWSSGGSAGSVSGLSVLKSDYTSAQLSWNSASNALGYNVYSGDTLVASLPNSMIKVTLGGLTSGASYDFKVNAVGGNGALGSPSDTVTITTKSLPGGRTIANWESTPGDSSTIIKADILVPYAFVRLYI